MRKLNVLFISSWYPDRITEVNGDFIKRHAEAVSEMHQVVALFVKFDPAMRYGKQLVESSGQNFHEIIIYFNCGRFGFGRISKIVNYLRYYIWGYKYVREKIFEPDIIHANVIYPVGIIARTFKSLFKKPYIISEHWSNYLSINFDRIPVWQKIIDKIVVKHADRIAPVTNNLKESLQKLGYKADYEIVPNVVDITRFYPSEEQKVLTSFIHISTLFDKIKNIRGLLEGVKKLSELRKDFLFTFVGNGELEDHIQYATELGIMNKYVQFHGKVDHSEVRDLLSNSSCLVMFSNYESLPCVIIESLACGIPVISTDVGGIKEHITSDKGILISKGNIDELVKAMNYMLDNHSSFNKNKLREYAIANFSEEAIANKFNAIYQSVVTNG